MDNFSLARLSMLVGRGAGDRDEERLDGEAAEGGDGIRPEVR